MSATPVNRPVSTVQSDVPSAPFPTMSDRDRMTTETFHGAVLTASRWFGTMGVLSVSAIVSGVLCLQFGAQEIGLADTARIMMRAVTHWGSFDEAEGAAGIILMQVRLPRVLLGFAVGSCLAAVGVALQALLRNHLADPYVLGVSSGAALGVTLAVLSGIGTSVLAEAALPACGFAGGLLALVVVYRMAASYERLPIHSLLLAGVILNAIFSALIMFITSIMEPNRSFGMMAWLMGTLGRLPTIPHSSCSCCICLSGCSSWSSRRACSTFWRWRGNGSLAWSRNGKGQAVHLYPGRLGNGSSRVGQRHDWLHRHGDSAYGQAPDWG